MTIIEADSVNTQPLVVDSIQIFAAQRYSFVVRTYFFPFSCDMKSDIVFQSSTLIKTLTTTGFGPTPTSGQRVSLTASTPPSFATMVRTR